MNKKYIIPYKNPDLDGTACAFGYAEYLNKIGIESQAIIYGHMHREAKFVFDKFKIEDIARGEEVNITDKDIVVVDASDIRGLSEVIKPEQVVEIIDHRKVHEANTFPNAKVQIELVGSVATLVAEKYFKNNVKISKSSSALLLFAIVSNTINFQSNITTERDVKIAKWLKTKFAFDNKHIKQIFIFKSQFTKPLKETIDDDFATFDFNNNKIGVAQLEIVDVDRFIKKNVSSINKVLEELKKEKSLDYVFMSFIDVEKAFNRYVVLDDEMQLMLEKILKIKFTNHLARRENIMMRKETIPLLKDYFN